MNEGIIAKAQEQNAASAKTKKSSGTTKDLVQRMLPGIKNALPSVMTPERFTRIVLTALSVTPKLNSCTQESFLGAMMEAAQLGLEVNTKLGHAYLIPYGNQCQFQIGYKGLIDLAYRSGKVLTIEAHTVYENDAFSYELGLEPKLRHAPVLKDRGEPICFYAKFTTKDGGYGFEVMSVEDVRAHAKKYSNSYGNGPWQTAFEEMAKKTVLKHLLKYAPLGTEVSTAISADGNIIEAKEEDVIGADGDLDLNIIDVDDDTGEVLDGAVAQSAESDT